jgi:hypothetical protein
VRLRTKLELPDNDQEESGTAIWWSKSGHNSDINA